MHAGAARRIREPCRHLQRLRLLFIILHILAGPCRAIRSGHDRAVWLRFEIASHRNRQQRWLPAAILPRRGRAGAGIEPAANVAQAAIAKGIPSRTIFFGRDTARDLEADLLIGNNVYAHVPDLHSFTEGLKIALKPDGLITLEFPHLLRLDGRSAVRHHLSRAFLVSLANDRPKGLHASWAHCVRCRGASHTRRIASHFRPACRKHNPRR